MINGRRTTDKLVANLTQAYKFAEPLSDPDIPLQLAEGVADRLLVIPEKIPTEELIQAAKRRCPPLRGSINSRAFALAVLASVLLFAVFGMAQNLSCSSSISGAICQRESTVIETNCGLLGDGPCRTREYQVDSHGREVGARRTPVEACRDAIHDFKDGSGSQEEVNHTCSGLAHRYSKWVKETK